MENKGKINFSMKEGVCMRESMDDFFEMDDEKMAEVISEQFVCLRELREKCQKMKESNKWAGWMAMEAFMQPKSIIQKQGMIEKMQNAILHLSGALHSFEEMCDVIFEYLKKISEVTKYLFMLGASNIAMNRRVIRLLEEKLSKASAEELDDYEREEIKKVIRQLKEQEDYMMKQEQLQNRLKTLENRIVVLEKRNRASTWKRHI